MRGLKSSPHVLIVEDDASLVEALESILASEGYRVTTSRRGDEGCQRALAEHPDIIVTDLRLPGMGGLDLVRKVRHARPNVPIVMMTAHGSPDAIIESTKEGAVDYLSKPFEIPALLEIIKRSLEGANAAPTNLTPIPKPPGLVGKSLAMQAIYKEIGRLAPRPVTVLIRGETGTGKELVARALHAHSGRSANPFIAVNCASISETLLESELFGHERGAFTGAIERRIGRFEQAGDGTLFLDEIGELGTSTQAKLLRVLQEGTFERVGGRHPIPCNARIIAATHVDIEAALAARTFREDLFYRLNQASIALPPLRQRPEDIPEIAAHLALIHSSRMGCTPIALDAACTRLLKEHPWPGNVRELENVIRQTLIRCHGRTPTPEEIARLIKSSSPHPGAKDSNLEEVIQQTLDAAERGEIEDSHAVLVRHLESTLLSKAMARAGGNQSQVARWLGISRVTLREKLRALGLRSASD